jgi:hypothetical protein
MALEGAIGARLRIDVHAVVSPGRTHSPAAGSKLQSIVRRPSRLACTHTRAHTSHDGRRADDRIHDHVRRRCSPSRDTVN